MFTGRRLLQRWICSSSTLRTADWQVGWRVYYLSPSTVTLWFGTTTAMSQFLPGWKPTLQRSRGFPKIFCYVFKVDADFFGVWSSTLSFLHQRVPGCSVARLSWKSRGSSGRKGEMHSDRFALFFHRNISKHGLVVFTSSSMKSHENIDTVLKYVWVPIELKSY